MRRYAFVLLLVACGGDEDSKSDTSTTTPTDAAPDTNNPLASALTGVVKPASPDPEPTPNASCASAGNQTYTPTTGFVYPWQGVSAGGTDFTCNGCPTGDADVQGSWRVHGFANPDGSGDQDYSFPDPLTDYAEVLKVDGNTFEIHIRDMLSPVGERDSIFRGWYFCAQKPEQGNEHLFWVVTEVDDGPRTVGEVFESDVILGQANNIATFWFRSVGSSENDQAQYCRIGSTNSDNAEQTCTDPL